MIFDPSKLNLNVEEDNEKNWLNQEIKNEKKEEIKKEETEIKKEVETQDDVLADLNIEKNENNENQIIEKEKDINESNDIKLENKEEAEETQKEEKKVEENKIEKESEEKKVIYDININSIKDVLTLLIDKSYDFVTFEPDETSVKINFRKDKVIVDTRYIKYPTYSNILIKTKSIAKLKVEETEKEQEWMWEANIRNKWYDVLTKVVPWAFWEKMFIKAKEKKKKVAKKETKKMSLSQIMTFLWALAFIWLIVWGSFIWFIAMNAKTVEDVKFFASLWINLNEINNFISSSITIIFSTLVFFETAVLIMLLFKFALTKKEFKQKKIKYWILSTVVLIMTFSTASAWMIIDRKVNSLPNWQEMALWEIQIFDNAKLISDQFDKVWSIVQDTSNLIWPVELKFDLWFFQDSQEAKWYKINKYIWDFWWDDIIETPLSNIIKRFDKKWINEVTLTVMQEDIQGNIIEKVIEDIPSINISYLVDMSERDLWNWSKQVTLNASSLNELWNIEWYLMDNLEKPVSESETYITRPIFEETLIGMYIRNSDKESELLDKIFIIKSIEKWEIEADIEFQRWIVNDMEYTFKVSNIESWEWRGFIETFEWKIWDKEYTRKWDVNNQEKSSEIKHIFENYWNATISVKLTNTFWDIKTLTKDINIPKKLKITKWVDIFADNKIVEAVDYKQNLNEYILNNIGIPNTMKFDARFIEIDSDLYTLKTVNWDYDSDGDNDFSWRVWEYDLNSEWNHTITLKAIFEHRKIDDEIIEVEQKIYIEAVQKEAILDFLISKNSEYVPVVVWFDASRVQVKDSNIAKFIWDYGDGETEERDAVVPWHIYTKAWEYEVKLTILTSDWKRYSTTKNLILKPKAQTISIKASMKNAPVYQWIDFSSEWSDWQISSYFWDFGDGETSTKANPTHAYKKAWDYKVKLRLDFVNRNVLKEEIDISIY